MFHPFKFMPNRDFAWDALHGLNIAGAKRRQPEANFTGLTWIKPFALRQ